LSGARCAPFLVADPDRTPDTMLAARLRGRDAIRSERGDLPVVVTENGIGTDDDAQPVSYYREARSALTRCLEAGIDVRGCSERWRARTPSTRRRSCRRASAFEQRRNARSPARAFAKSPL